MRHSTTSSKLRELLRYVQISRTELLIYLYIALSYSVVRRVVESSDSHRFLGFHLELCRTLSLEMEEVFTIERLR